MLLTISELKFGVIAMKNKSKITTIVIDGRTIEIGYNETDYIPRYKIFCDDKDCIEAPIFAMNVIEYLDLTEKKYFEFYLCEKCQHNIHKNPTRFLEHAERRL